MERYLLFDSGCSLCRHVALSIERESNGWLIARSLRDEPMQALLNKVKPGWQWQPMLVEVQEERIRVQTGVRLRLRLLTGLGPRRAWHIAKLVYQTNSSLQTDQAYLGRRTLLKRAGALLGGAILGLGIGNFIFRQDAHAMSVTQNPFTITPIASNDPVIGQLNKSDLIQRTNTSFGVPNLADVQKVEYHLTGETVYIIPYDLQKEQPVIQDTFLAVLGSSLQSTAKGLVGQLLHANGQIQEFAWLTPDAHYIATVTGYRDGRVEVSTNNPYALGKANFVKPLSFLGCLNACLSGYHILPLCISLCDSCFNTAIPPVCAACYGCSAGEYFVCVFRCTFG